MQMSSARPKGTSVGCDARHWWSHATKLGSSVTLIDFLGFFEFMGRM